jgi:hypothetical protein
MSSVEIPDPRTTEKAPTTTRLIRQGDILLKLVSRLPRNSTKLDDNVLARGETTGHAHRIVGGDLYRSPGSNQLLVVVSEEEATLVHEEHKHLQIPKGTYRVINQREYDPLQERRTRVVRD